MNKAICSLDNVLVIKYRVVKDRECTETRGLRMQFGSVKSSLGWREIASHLEREVHLKVLNC